MDNYEIDFHKGGDGKYPFFEWLKDNQEEGALFLKTYLEFLKSLGLELPADGHDNFDCEQVERQLWVFWFRAHASIVRVFLFRYGSKIVILEAYKVHLFLRREPIPQDVVDRNHALMNEYRSKYG